MATSQNGWPANDRNLTKSWKIPGTTRAIRLESGDAGYVLVHFAAWFDANIEIIDTGELDDWGYAERPIRGSTTTLSNHASGTAEDLNATRHPLAVVNTFSKAQAAKIRAKLKEYDGVIRWGGDYNGRKDEMHFEINASKARVTAVAKKLRGQVTPPPVANRPIGATIHLSALNYAANGGYFHSGQAKALGEVLIFLGWYLRRGRARGGVVQVQFERDVRVWKAFCEQAHQAKTVKAEMEAWQKAGAQFKGIVRKVQGLYGLTADGIVGPKTGAVLAHDNYNVVP